MITVVNLLSGRDLEPSQYNSANEGIPYITGASNFEKNKLIINRWTNKPVTISKFGDLLITCKGTIGAMAYNSVGNIHIARQVMAISSYLVHVKYIELYLKNKIRQLEENAKSFIPGISRDDIKLMLIPLPPLAEQERVVKRVEELFAYIDTIDDNQAELEKLYDDLKKRVLDLAIRGKLVPQDPNDEPAKVLLEKIRAEKKAKLGKKYVDSFIYKGDDNCYYEKVVGNAPVLLENLPFDIPDSWCWIRLGTIVDFSKSISISPTTIEESAWVLDLEDIEKDSGKVLCKKRKRTLKVQSDKHKFKAGDVLYSKLRPYLNKVVIADEDGYCTSEILVLDFVPICNRYAQLYLMSPYFVDYAMAGAYGVKMPRLGSERGNNAFMPIPPLQEQVRIADQVDKIFANIKDKA